MEKQALIEFLAKSPLLHSNVIEAIADRFEYKFVAKGDFLLKEGRISNDYFFLDSGYMRSYLLDTNGNEITLNLYGPHHLVFEVASFFKRIPSQENYEALTDCQGWALSFERLNALFHALPEFREFGRAMLVNGFAAFKARTLSHINQTAESRYEHFMQTKPEFFQHVPLKYIASYLGITDTSLSRIRKNLARK